MHLPELINKSKPLFFTLSLLLIFAFLGFRLISNAPEVKRLDYVQVKPSSQGVTLGWQALGQHKGANSAEKEHLNISKTHQQWLLKNVSSAKRVDIRTSAVDTRYLRRAALETGDLLQFNTFKIVVKQADDQQLILYDLRKKQTIVWNGSELLVNQKSGFNACERQGLRRFLGGISDWLHWKIRAFNPQQTLRLFTLGGQVHCTTRWEQTDLPPDAIRFYWQNGHYWMGPGSEPTRVFIYRKGKKQDLNYLTLPTVGKEGSVKRLILGRTHYLLNENPKVLTLKPIANQQVFQVAHLDDAKTDEEREAFLKKENEEKQRLKALADKGIILVYQKDSWIGNSVTAAPFGLRSLLLFAILLIVSIAYVLILNSEKKATQGRSHIGSLLILSGISFTLVWAAFAWRGDLGASLAILWGSALWATLLLAMQGKLRGISSLLWFSALLIAGIGTLTLTQLAAGSDNTRWLRYAFGNIFIVSLTTSTIALLALMPLQALNGIWLLLIRHQSKLIVWLKALVIGSVVFLLLMQFAIGTEQGIWSIQPVEVAKLLIIIIAAHALWHLKMLRSINSRHYRENPLARIILFLWVLFAFIMISLLIAVGVHDYSPTLIVMALMAAFLWRAIPHPVRKLPIATWTIRSITILLPLMVVIGFALWFYQHPPDYDSSIPQAERLRIWSNPELYPEASSQLLNSLARIGQGGWYGTGWFGNNGSAMQIPAVQDDFIAAFLLNHFGGVVGLLLLSMQLLWIGTLFSISEKLTYRQPNQELYAAHNVLGNILFGLTWIHLLHWLISWGNVLGLMPIMGQPMTWLSAGNSHLMAIGMMTLVLAMLGSWAVEGD
ncbi:MAG: FtsW/RodA/SpoVE family cell cycle protein [Cocleimonas sp.]|nr:FtsW/RodA/SpoVE family cell cycle protein [Cocleimonas sp.]